jgi:hypothetical protein
LNLKKHRVVDALQKALALMEQLSVRNIPMKP